MRDFVNYRRAGSYVRKRTDVTPRYYCSSCLVYLFLVAESTLTHTKFRLADIIENRAVCLVALVITYLREECHIWTQHKLPYGPWSKCRFFVFVF